MSQEKKKNGSLEVICGPMFSGKSEELIRRLRRAEIAQQNVAVFKHTIDNRYDEKNVTSHNGTKLLAHAISDCNQLFERAERAQYTVVGIDEVHFYDRSIVQIICHFIENGVRVIVAGLDMDHRGVPFGPMPTLLAIADSITKLQAICTQCGANAHFSQLLTQKQPVNHESEPLVLVGASDTYTARCRECYRVETPFDYSHYKETSS